MVDTCDDRLGVGRPGHGADAANPAEAPAPVYPTTQSFVPDQRKVDLANDKTLFVVATAHLDTQWRWTVQDTIERFIPATLRRNFALFEKYPNYVFSFEGAFRYMLAKEYYPQDYQRLKGYVESGRWRVAGSSVDAGDVNIPSPESLMRQVLYGNGFFRQEFGKVSRDIFLPDCFGFGYALPTVAAHCGLQGFSTQKLGWGGAVPNPFVIGAWAGPDGSTILAALGPGNYSGGIGNDLSTDAGWLHTIDDQARESGLPIAYRYFGTGDRAAHRATRRWPGWRRASPGSGAAHVVSSASDDLCRDVTDEQTRAMLKRYQGELIMRTHGTGCYTSQAAMKRWNRRNEQLADAAERASVAADWLGGLAYPRDELDGGVDALPVAPVPRRPDAARASRRRTCSRGTMNCSA